MFMCESDYPAQSAAFLIVKRVKKVLAFEWFSDMEKPGKRERLGSREAE